MLLVLILMAYKIASASPEKPKKTVEAVDDRRMEIIHFNKVLGSKVLLLLLLNYLVF